MQKIWFKIKHYGRLIKALHGFLYDFIRFFRYTAWHSNFKDTEIRNYHAVKIYHSLEKSMSFKDQNPNSGWLNAFALIDLLKIANRSKDVGFHDKVATNILTEFIKIKRNKNTKNANRIESELKKIQFSTTETCGCKNFSEDDFKKGILPSPENFFFSRYSLREFKNERVDENTIQKALSLSIKAPSVCNRQPWHVYHTAEPTVIKAALKYQAGNRGFGDNIPNLLIITSDLKAFMSGSEHYQHWIDGGLFSMSLVFALHSLGVASCCLNWSETPGNDKKLRSIVNIQSHHTVIMMLAIGWPDKMNSVCLSVRRPVKEIYSPLILKNKTQK